MRCMRLCSENALVNLCSVFERNFKAHLRSLHYTSLRCVARLRITRVLPTAAYAVRRKKYFVQHLLHNELTQRKEIFFFSHHNESLCDLNGHIFYLQ